MIRMSDDAPKPSSIHSKKLGRFTRRRMLKTLSAAGISSAALGLLDLETVRGAASDQIPISMDVEGESTTYVAADWYDRLVKARKVKDKISRRWLPEQANDAAKEATPEMLDSVTGVWLDAGSGKSEPHVIVSLVEGTKGLSNARGTIPEKQNGISVKTEVTERKEELTACNPQTKSDTSEMPGGLEVNFFTSDGSASGTFTSRVYDTNNYEFKIATAAHVPEYATNGQCGSSLEGMTARHGGDKIGEVDFIDHEHDIAIIDLDLNTSALDEAWNPSDFNTTCHVKSTMSKDGVDNFMNSNNDVRKFGIKNCDSSGPIEGRGKKERAFYNEECTQYWYDCIRWGSFTSIGAGDSGSVTFGADPNGDGYLATNINSWRWYNYASGPAGYAIENNHGYYWG